MVRPTAVRLAEGGGAGWREQGISYLKYLNICTESLHRAVKPAKQAKYQRFSIAAYEAKEPDGQGGTRLVNKVPANYADYVNPEAHTPSSGGAAGGH